MCVDAPGDWCLEKGRIAVDEVVYGHFKAAQAFSLISSLYHGVIYSPH